MKSIQTQLRKTYWDKLQVLMSIFPDYKEDFEFVKRRLVYPRLRRMNGKKDFAEEPLPKNLPFNGKEPKYSLYFQLRDDLAVQYKKMLRYHGFIDQRGRCQNSLFVESLIYRAYHKVEKKDPDAIKRVRSPYISSIVPAEDSHVGENWFGKND